MTESEIRTKYPEVEQLYSVIEELGLTLRSDSASDQLKAISFCTVSIKKGSQLFLIPVDDEYEDSPLQNPALLLQLVLFSMDEYEDCENFLVWSTAYSLDKDDPFVLDLYTQTSNIVPQLRELIGHDIRGISDYDWQLDAGAAQGLREMNL